MPCTAKLLSPPYSLQPPWLTLEGELVLVLLNLRPGHRGHAAQVLVARPQNGLFQAGRVGRRSMRRWVYAGLPSRRRRLETTPHCTQAKRHNSCGMSCTAWPCLRPHLLLHLHALNAILVVHCAVRHNGPVCRVGNERGLGVGAGPILVAPRASLPLDLLGSTGTACNALQAAAEEWAGQACTALHSAAHSQLRSPRDDASRALQHLNLTSPTAQTQPPPHESAQLTAR